MPELPDIVVLARSLDQALVGKALVSATVHQPRCLNRDPAALERLLAGRTICRVWQRGKWVLLDLDSGDILALHLGMGGEVRLHRPEDIADPRRERVTFRLATGEQLWVHFWWFGQVHIVPHGDLTAHPQLGRLGPDPLAPDFTVARLVSILRGRRGPLKKYLLDQHVIAGIGNVYVQDALWHARLHPLTPAARLGTEEVARLHAALRHVLQEGIRWGGGPGEQDVWGHQGIYAEHLQVGYRTGQPCPACGTPIAVIRVCATASYICPQCQPEPTRS